MENDISKIYHNSFGIAFHWLDPKLEKKCEKIQLIFRNMGFHLSPLEIKEFCNCINAAKQSETCEGCQEDCERRNIMVKSPSNKVSLAVNKTELLQLEDLIKGTLFQLDMHHYLNHLCKN